MHIGLVTESGHPGGGGHAGLWHQRLVRGLGQHEFAIHSRDSGSYDDGVVHGRRARRRFTESYGELGAALTDASGAPAGVVADRFATALYGLAELTRDEGGLARALRSEDAVRALERACRAPGALPIAREARVPELLAVVAHLERALRPMSFDWYSDDPGASAGLGRVDLCHATSGGPWAPRATALPGLLARHFSGVPLLVTEYGVWLRSHYLDSGAPDASVVRALLAVFHGRLAIEVYRRAVCVTQGDAHTRRRQERCGADRDRLRIVHPGLAADRFAEVGEAPDTAGPYTPVWVGRVGPAKDLVSLLHSFAQVRRERPGARPRIIGTPGGSVGRDEGEACLGHCRMPAAQLFPDEADGPHAVGDNPVSFAEIGGPEAPGTAEAYAAGAVVVLSSVVEGFPVGLVEAMFCGRATVSTDVGAVVEVVEVVGGTGLVVPPRNPRALAEACGALLRDPERRVRLGAAARALELFSAEQNIEAFHGVYLEIVAHGPARRGALDGTGGLRPFAVPAEARLPGRWTGSSPSPVPPSPVPASAASSPVPASAASSPVSAPAIRSSVIRPSAVSGSVVSAPLIPAPVVALEVLR